MASIQNRYYDSSLVVLPDLPHHDLPWCQHYWRDSSTSAHRHILCASCSIYYDLRCVWSFRGMQIGWLNEFCCPNCAWVRSKCCPIPKELVVCKFAKLQGNCLKRAKSVLHLCWLALQSVREVSKCRRIRILQDASTATAHWEQEWHRT